MGTIKDLTDLVTQYIESVDDRRFAGELREIQKMIIAIQREQSVLQKQNASLQSENIELKKQIHALEATSSEAGMSTTETPVGISDLMLQILQFSSVYEEGVTVGMVQHKFSISAAKSELQLGKLQGARLIDYGSVIVDEDIKYVPTQEGLELLDEHGLI